MQLINCFCCLKGIMCLCTYALEICWVFLVDAYQFIDVHGQCCLLLADSNHFFISEQHTIPNIVLVNNGSPQNKKLRNYKYIVLHYKLFLQKYDCYLVQCCRNATGTLDILQRYYFIVKLPYFSSVSSVVDLGRDFSSSSLCPFTCWGGGGGGVCII